jgi:N-acetyl-gamma-glutamyl-phosphate reductase
MKPALTHDTAHAGAAASTVQSPRICIVGERGQVSLALQRALAENTEYSTTVVSTDSVLKASELPGCITTAGLVVLCTQDFVSPEVFKRLPEHIRVLDVSPAFRTDPAWVYGLPELPGTPERIATARLVANPGCFATSAILLLEPLVRNGLLPLGAQLYLDGVGGFSTGGAALMAKADSGELAVESVFGLTREHRHIPEIRHITGLQGPMFFSPKIVRAARGIRMQIPLFGVDARDALDAYLKTYEGTDVQVDTVGPGRVPADEWAHEKGACVRVYSQSGGILVVCTMDNLGKGAVESALNNIIQMFRGVGAS